MRLTAAIAMGCTVLMLGTWTSAFQSGPQPAPTSNPADGQNSSSAASQTAKTSTAGAVHVSVIGCVQRTPATTADNTTTIVPDGETRYVLSNVTLSGHGASDSDGRGSVADVIAESVNLYRLDDSSDALIAPHVGDRVHINGSVISEPAGTSGRRSTQTASKGPLLKVEYLERVSAASAACLP